MSLYEAAEKLGIECLAADAVDKDTSAISLYLDNTKHCILTDALCVCNDCTSCNIPLVHSIDRLTEAVKNLCVTVRK